MHHDASLSNFNVTQLANKLEHLALATPHNTKVTRPESTVVVDDDFYLREHPDSTDSDSGRPVTSNNSSVYKSFVGDSVESQQLDSLDFSLTHSNGHLNDSCGYVESVHENLASVNLDLVCSDFEDSSHNLATHSFPNNSLSKEKLDESHHSDLNFSTSYQNNSPMDDTVSETKSQVCFLYLYIII